MNRGVCGIGLSFGLLLGVLPAPLSAAEMDYQARAWAAGCAACHGTEGRGDGVIPPLAGRDRAQLLDLLKSFKVEHRVGITIMHQHARGYSDAQLDRIAAYFSRQAP